MFIIIPFLLSTLGNVFGQLPTLEIKQFDASNKSVKLLCRIPKESSSITFVKNVSNVTVLDIRLKNKRCEVFNQTKYQQCQCEDDFSAVCTIYVENMECDGYACGVPEGQQILLSKYVNLCETGNRTDQNDDKDEKCSSWIINDIQVNNSDTAGLQIRKYDRVNISIALNWFERDENNSIITCKLVENIQQEWTRQILHPPRRCHNLTKGNPGVSTYQVKRGSDYSSCLLQSNTSLSAITIALCDAVNRRDLVTPRFDWNSSSRFELETLFPAYVRSFYIDGYESQDNLTLNGIENITFSCNGIGNPPPYVTLFLDQTTMKTTDHSSLQHHLYLNAHHDSNEYVCMSSNALGGSNKSLFINILIFPPKKEGRTSLVVATGAICAVAVAIVVLFVAKKHQHILKYFRPLHPSGLPGKENQLNTPGTFFDREILHNDGIEDFGTIHERETPIDEGCESSPEHAAIVFAFENETYAGCLDQHLSALNTYTPAKVHSARYGSQQSQPHSLELEKNADDPLYSVARQPGPSLAGATLSHNKMIWVENGQQSSEECTYSVVNKTKRPAASAHSVDKTKGPEGILYSRANQEERTDDYTYSVVNTSKRTRKTCRQSLDEEGNDAES